MATALKRFDGKLDALLRKNLSFELYERLIAIESCIVVTHGGKKALRHVILGHTELYFAEVPPKSLKRALRLNDVLSVNTVSIKLLWSAIRITINLCFVIILHVARQPVYVIY